MIHTEATVTAALRRWHEVPYGAVPKYAFVAQVRNDAGFSATRTFDAVALHLWESNGLEVIVYEVKVSRSDWLRELKTPEKTAAALDVADRFVVVAPAGIVKTEELGAGWGLIEIGANGRARTKVKGRRLSPPTWRTFMDRRGRPYRGRAFEPMRRGLVVALLRNTNALAVAEGPRFTYHPGGTFA